MRATSGRLTTGVVHATLLVATGQLSRGFRAAGGALSPLRRDRRLRGRTPHCHERQRSASRADQFLSDFRDLKVGDLVVHVDSGIGRFVGLKRLAISPLESSGRGQASGARDHEFMELRYAGDDKLFVPLDRLDLVQKYTGGAAPALDKLGGTTWEKAKTRVKKAMRDMAEELLKLYAARKAVRRPRVRRRRPTGNRSSTAPSNTSRRRTSKQRSRTSSATWNRRPRWTAFSAATWDTEKRKWRCAAFKAVMDGKQVAFLAPTTVLAFQHVRTLQQRFAGFPVRIEMISRFRSPSEQKTVGCGARRRPKSTSSSAHIGCSRRTWTFAISGSSSSTKSSVSA